MVEVLIQNEGAGPSGASAVSFLKGWFIKDQGIGVEEGNDSLLSPSNH